MIPQLTTGEINRIVTMLNDKLRKEGLCAIDMAPNGYCFYRAHYLMQRLEIKVIISEYVIALPT